MVHPVVIMNLSNIYNSEFPFPSVLRILEVSARCQFIWLYNETWFVELLTLKVKGQTLTLHLLCWSWKLEWLELKLPWLPWWHVAHEVVTFSLRWSFHLTCSVLLFTATAHYEWQKWWSSSGNGQGNGAWQRVPHLPTGVWWQWQGLFTDMKNTITTTLWTQLWFHRFRISFHAWLIWLDSIWHFPDLLCQHFDSFQL